MGLTYKENVADTRETPVKGVIKELEEYGVELYGYDPCSMILRLNSELNPTPPDY